MFSIETALGGTNVEVNWIQDTYTSIPIIALSFYKISVRSQVYLYLSLISF